MGKQSEARSYNKKKYIFYLLLFIIIIIWMRIGCVFVSITQYSKYKLYWYVVGISTDKEWKRRRLFYLFLFLYYLFVALILLLLLLSLML